MRTIGLLGGMSWESTQTYYRLINEGIKAELGGLHSAKIAMVSVDFAPLETLQHQGDWEGITDELIRNAQQIEAAGAECLLICTNTMHKVADSVQAVINIPLLHIADATAQALIQESTQTVGLLGTAFTMQEPFYKERLKDKHGLDVITPNSADQKCVHDIIYNELCLGKITDASKVECLRIIDALAKQGAQGVILGCTEIPLLVHQTDTSIKLFDTTTIHAQAAINFALQ